MEAFILRAHAAQMARERGVELEWIRRTLQEPAAVLPDARDKDLTHLLQLQSRPE